MADMTKTADRYSAGAMLLHWAIALLIFTNIGLALAFEAAAQGPAKLALIQTHKAVGITVLLLSVLRLVWRLVNPPPPLSAHLKPWEKGLAHAVHWTFYVFMIGMPLTGWAMVSASPRIKVFPIDMFGLFNWPAIAPLANLPRPQMREANEFFEGVHTGPMLWLGLLLIALHVLGALKHQFIDRDGELGRIIGFLPAPGRKDGAG